jgi:MtfA peptidase
MNHLKNWWARRGRMPIADRCWSGVVQSQPWLARLRSEELLRLRDLAERFQRQKDIVGAGGLEIDEGMRATIAVQACLPVLHLGLEWYRGWYSVIVYPDDFVAPYEYTDEDGVVHHGERELSGEAWPDGPVILSWSTTRTQVNEGWGGNLVIHEFAHKLDLLNGDANGLPPLHPGMSVSAWREAFTAAYEDFCWRVEREEWVAFDEYAAEDPGEFFAVLSEWFFMDPQAVRAHYPAVHDQLERFYRPAGALGR